MSRMVTRMFQLGPNCPTTALRVVRGSWEDEFLQQFERPCPPRPPEPSETIRQRVRRIYYESRWVLLLIACQITSISLVCWATYRLVHGS